MLIGYLLPGTLFIAFKVPLKGVCILFSYFIRRRIGTNVIHVYLMLFFSSSKYMNCKFPANV